MKATKAQRADDRPPMPKEPIQRASGPLDFRLRMDSGRFSSGSLSFTHDRATVSGDDGKEIGAIANCVGGGVEVYIGERHWYLSALEIFKAAQGVDERYMKEGK